MTIEELAKKISENPKLLQELANLTKTPTVVKEKKDPFEKPPHYGLEVMTYCNLCKSYTFKFFDMYYLGGSGYVSKRVVNRIDICHPVKRMIKAVSSCVQCPHELQKWPQERLIRELIRSRTEVIDELFKQRKIVEEYDTSLKENEKEITHEQVDIRYFRIRTKGIIEEGTTEDESSD
jgi:hypothetical protein